MFKQIILIISILFGSTFAISDIQLRVNGGKDARIEDFPFQASILFKGVHICGAVIISEHYVITAAHCMNTFSNSLSLYLVKVKSNYIDQGTVHPLSNVLLHDKYSDKEFDVALIKLRIPIIISTQNSAPITLETNDKINFQGKIGVACGWGNIPQNSTILQQVNLTFISTSLCNQLYSQITKISENMLCAGNIEYGGVGGCEGDFGGPIIFDKKLVGIGSFSHGCGQPGYPTVFTKISAVQSWIVKNMT